MPSGFLKMFYLRLPLVSQRWLVNLHLQKCQNSDPWSSYRKYYQNFNYIDLRPNVILGFLMNILLKVTPTLPTVDASGEFPCLKLRSGDLWSPYR